MPNFIKLTVLNAANKLTTPGIWVRTEEVVAVQEASDIERGHHPQANAIVHVRTGGGYLVRENVPTILAKISQADLGQAEEPAEDEA